MSISETWEEVLRVLEGRFPGCRAPGLTGQGLARIESELGIRFPSDLATMLMHGVPALAEFPNWHGPMEPLSDWMLEPVLGVLFDVEHNSLWLEEWGSRPADVREAIRSAGAILESAPRLIPVYRHRYLPSEPSTAGNPVFSILQADIIVYGADLESYLRREFLGGMESVGIGPRKVRVWTSLASE